MIWKNVGSLLSLFIIQITTIILGEREISYDHRGLRVIRNSADRNYYYLYDDNESRSLWLFKTPFPRGERLL